MQLRFRPWRRASDYSELPQWIFKINEENKQQLQTKDKPKENNNEKDGKVKGDHP